MPVRFGKLPPTEHPGGGAAIRHKDEAAVLRSQPDDWAQVFTKKTAAAAHSIAYGIRSGTLKAFTPAGDFEATVRGADVWARYVGDGKPDAE